MIERNVSNHIDRCKYDDLLYRKVVSTDTHAHELMQVTIPLLLRS